MEEKKQNKELINSLEKDFQIVLSARVSLEEIQKKLSDYINSLIIHDFNKLVSLLYRIDVSETKLKYLLKENPGIAAGNIIAGLIIERQLQKLKSRQDFRKDENIKDDEKW